MYNNNPFYESLPNIVSTISSIIVLTEPFSSAILAKAPFLVNTNIFQSLGVSFRLATLSISLHAYLLTIDLLDAFLRTFWVSGI